MALHRPSDADDGAGSWWMMGKKEALALAKPWWWWMFVAPFKELRVTKFERGGSCRKGTILHWSALRPPATDLLPCGCKLEWKVP